MFREATAALFLGMHLVIWVTLLGARTFSHIPTDSFDDDTNKATDASGNVTPAFLLNGGSWVPARMGGGSSASTAARWYPRTPPTDLSSTKAVTEAPQVNRTCSTASGHVLFEAASGPNHPTRRFTVLPNDDTGQGIQTTCMAKGCSIQISKVIHFSSKENQQKVFNIDFLVRGVGSNDV